MTTIDILGTAHAVVKYKSGRRLPKGVYLMACVATLCQGGTTSTKEATRQVATALSRDWIANGLTPKTMINIQKQLTGDYDAMKRLGRSLRKQGGDKQSKANRKKDFDTKMNEMYDVAGKGGIATQPPTKKRKAPLPKTAVSQLGQRGRPLYIPRPTTLSQQSRSSADDGSPYINPKDALEEKRAPYQGSILRSSRTQICEPIGRVWTKCMSRCKVSEEDLRFILVTVNNDVYLEHTGEEAWVLESDLGDASEQDDSLEDEEGLKRRRVATDLSNVFPSRRAMRDWMKAGAILELKCLADKVHDKDDDTVITWGCDDGSKAAGVRTYDVKASHVTVQKKGEERRTFTAGFLENISHTAENAAMSMQFTLDVLGLLAGVSGEDIKHNIDFWMADRASDVDPSLEKLGIPARRRLKCCAHIILCIDEALEKVFKDREQRVGLSKLLEVQSSRFNIAGRGSSILTLGQIALAKVLSPSHASGTISLYDAFCDFMEKQDTKNEFKGFVSNRFGRKANSAVLFLKHRSLIKKFFEEQVDENSNLLWLACHAYLNNEWFHECSTIYADVAVSVKT